jgi:hypothetical protein
VILLRCFAIQKPKNDAAVIAYSTGISEASSLQSDRFVAALEIFLLRQALRLFVFELAGSVGRWNFSVSINNAAPNLQYH